MDYLIHPEWFQSLPTLLLLLISSVSIFCLVKGADWLVESASTFAYRIGISKLIVGATIVSLGTTSPEAAVSVMAAWMGKSGLALGNAVGSIIADTGLIFGLGCLLTLLPADKFVLKRQGLVKIGSGLLLVAICYAIWFFNPGNPVLGQIVGILFLALLGWYLWISIRWSKQHHLNGSHQAANDAVQKVAHEPLVKLIAFMVLGLLVVVVFSHILIVCVSELAVRWDVPESVIAATIVALGTSLPELMVGMTAIYKGHKELLIGNIIGADILNVLFVVGASAVAAELPLIDYEARIPEIFLYIHLPTMLIILTLFLVFILMAVRRNHFSRWMGAPLLLLFLVFWLVTYLLS